MLNKFKRVTYCAIDSTCYAYATNWYKYLRVKQPSKVHVHVSYRQVGHVTLAMLQ